MPAINFTTLKNKVLSGEKKQTIRPKKTDHWLRFSEGDRLRGWWKQRSKENELLFESVLSEDPFVVKWRDFDDELMIQDGFKSLEDGNRKWFIPRYGRNGKVVPDKEFVVLRWTKPRR